MSDSNSACTSAANFGLPARIPGLSNGLSAPASARTSLTAGATVRRGALYPDSRPRRKLAISVSMYFGNAANRCNACRCSSGVSTGCISNRLGTDVCQAVMLLAAHSSLRQTRIAAEPASVSCRMP